MHCNGETVKMSFTGKLLQEMGSRAEYINNSEEKKKKKKKKKKKHGPQGLI